MSFICSISTIKGYFLESAFLVGFFYPLRDRLFTKFTFFVGVLNSYSAILFLTDQWQMPYEELLKAGSFGALAYGLGAIPAGWLADKLGRFTMMVAFFIGIGLSSIAAGLTSNATQLGIAVSFIGIFAAIYHPVGIAMVYSTSDKPGRALAVNGVMGNLGLAIAAVTTTLLSSWISWRTAFIVPCVISVLSGLVYWQQFREFDYAVGTTTKKHSPPLPDTKIMAKIFIAIAVIALCGGLAFSSLTTALPKIIAEDPLTRHLSLSNTGGIATLIFVFASMAQMVTGELMDRYSPALLLTILCGSRVILLLAAAMFESPFFLLAVILFVTFAQLPVNDWLTGRYSSDAWRSRFYALKYTLSLGVASAAYWLIALTYENSSGFSLLYLILGVGLMPATLAGSYLLKLTRQPQEITATR